MSRQTEIQPTKIAHLIAYLAKRQNLGKTRLMKLLYFIDFTAYEKLGRSITDATYQHWKYGPVPVNIESELTVIADEVFSIKKISEGQESFQSITALVDPELQLYYTPDEIEIIDAILAEFGAKNTGELIDISHAEIPWKITTDFEEMPYFLAPYRNYRKLTEEEIKAIGNDQEFMTSILHDFNLAT